MEQTKKRSAAGLVLKWILLIAADIAVVVLIPILFVYTQSAPVTPEGLAGLEYFSGCEITAITGRYAREDGTLDTRGSDVDSWVLYQNSAGEVRAVCLEWDLVAPRYRVKADTDTLIPAGEDPYTFTTGGTLTKRQVTVTGQNSLQTDNFHYSARKNLVQTAYGAGVAVLVLAEFAVGKAIQKRKTTVESGGGGHTAHAGFGVDTGKRSTFAAAGGFWAEKTKAEKSGRYQKVPAAFARGKISLPWGCCC